MTDILIKQHDGLMHLSLNRAEKKNALTQQMYASLADALEAAATNDQVRVVLISASGATFCAGNDIGDFLNRPAGASAAEMPVFRFLRAIASFPKPLVAAVQGLAVGIGTTMLLHCDLVYASDDARFSLPFVDLGLCPEAASSLLLPATMGHRQASAALLLAEVMSAEQALTHGLINAILSTDRLAEVALEKALRLTQKPMSSLLASKRLMKQSTLPQVQSRMLEEGEIFGQLMSQPAAREAFMAFMEKRQPDFSGC